MAIKSKKKTVLENSLQKVGKTTSNIYGGIKQQTSNTFGNFYSRFKQDYRNYVQQQQKQDIIQRQKIGEFAEGVKAFLNTTKTNITRDFTTAKPLTERDRITQMLNVPRLYQTAKVSLAKQKIKTPNQFITKLMKNIPENFAQYSTNVSRKAYGTDLPGRVVGSYGKALLKGPSTFFKNNSTYEKIGDIASTVGAVAFPGQVASMTAFNPLFVSGGALLEKRLPTKKELLDSLPEGVEFGAKMAPLSAAAEFILSPALKLIAPKELGNINAWIRAMKKAPTREASFAVAKEAVNRFGRNLVAKAISGGTGFGVYEGLGPAKTPEERIARIKEGFITGVAFSVGSEILGTGLSFAYPRGKGIIKASFKGKNLQSGFLIFPGWENLNSKDYKAEVKNRLIQATTEVKNIKGTVGMMKEARKLVKEFNKNPDKFIEKYSPYPKQITSTQPITVVQDGVPTQPQRLPPIQGEVGVTIPPAVTDVGITSFRGQPVKTIADSDVYYGTTRAKGFEKSLTTKAQDYGLQIKVEKSAGVWEVNLEPSYIVKAKGNINAIRAYTADHGMKGNQDAAGIFVQDQNGTGFKYELSRVQNPDVVIQNLKNNGISGATFNKKTGVLSIWDMDGSLQNNVVQLSKATNSLLKVIKGTVEFLEKKDYDKIIQEYQTSTSLPTTTTEAGGGGNILYQQKTRAGTTQATQIGLTTPFKITPEEEAFNLANLNKWRGFTPKTTSVETEQVLKRGNKIRIREFEAMKEDFQSQIDHIDGILKNYDLFKAKTEGDILATVEREQVNIPLRNLLNKIQSFAQGKEGKIPIIEGKTRFLTKTALKQVRSDLTKSLKEVNSQIKTLSAETVTREKAPIVPTNEELAMQQLRKMRGETIEQPPTPVEETPPIPDVKTAKTITCKPAVPPSITTIPQASKETPTVGQRERGHVTTVRERSDVRPGVKKEIAGNYNMETDEGRIRYGADYVEKNFETAKERALSAEPLSNELAGIHYGLNKKLTQLADTAETSGNVKEAALYDDQLAQIENNLAEKLTPGAQVLQFMRNWVDRSPQSILRWARKIYSEANQLGALSPSRLLKRVTGQTYKLELTSNMEKRIIAEMTQINRIKDEDLKLAVMHKLMREVVKDIPPSILELTTAYRYQNMLINPLTQLRNIYHKLKNAVVLRPLNLAASGDLKGAGNYYYHLVGGVKRGAEQWWQAMKGESGNAGKYIDTPYGQLKTLSQAVRRENIPGVLRVAGNMLEGADLFFTELIANSEYYVLKNKGLSDANAKNQAYLTAARYLYRKKLDPTNSSGQGMVLSGFDKATDAILQFRGKMPFGSWFLPFVRVPMAVAKAGFEYSPLGLTTIYKANNGQEQAGKALLGTLFLLAGAVKASSGETTWMAPTDKKEKQIFYDSGRKPFSVRVDNNSMLSWMANLPGSYKDKYDYAWIPMNYMGELGYSFALPTAFKYYSDETKTALTDSDLIKIGKSLGGFINYWTGQTPIEGLQGWVDMARGDQTYTTGRQLGFTAGQVVPLEGFLSFVSNIVDPIYRESKTFTSEFLRSIPGYSKQLPPIMTGYGQPASRNLSNFIAPYGVGYGTDAFEPTLQSRRQELQQNAVLNKFKKEVATRVETAVKLGTVVGGKEGVAATKKFLEGLYETYDTVDDEQIRAKIRQTIEERGYDFTEGYQQYLNKDTQISTQGLSSEAIDKLERSNEFKYIRTLFKKDQNSGLYSNLISEAMNKYNIAPKDYYYDEKTALPDDVQYDEIISSIGDLDYDSMRRTLISYRKVSEGTRKPLLTDTLINKLNKEGYLTDSLADYLKAVDWNSTDKTFEYNPPKSTIKKSAFKISVSKRTITTPKFKLSEPKQITFKPLQKKIVAKPRLPTRTTYRSVRFNTPSFRIRTPIQTLGELGGAR